MGHAVMTFRKLSDTEAELHQPPTPTFHLESWTRFTFVEPHSIDFRYRCVAQEPAFRRGYIGLFWASFIHAPLDKSLYFLGSPARGADSLWCQLYTLHHNDAQKTVRHVDDELDLTWRSQHGGPHRTNGRCTGDGQSQRRYVGAGAKRLGGGVGAQLGTGGT